ncbi:MAG: hypothetical protein ABR505_08695 [Actinomycetota bacterium]
MTAAWGALVHGILGLLLLGSRRASRPTRSRLVEAASATGFLTAILSLSSPPRWGVLEAGPDRWRIAGVGLAAAWAMVPVFDRGSGRVESGALIAGAGTGLAFFAATNWLVPALIFWACSSLAITALTYKPDRRGGSLLGLLGASDVLFVVGALSGRGVTQVWTLGGVAGDVPTALWFWAALLRLGFAVGAARAAPAAEETPAVPLAVAGAFLLLVGFGQSFSTGTIAIAAGFALSVGLLTALTSEPRPLSAAWVSTASLALAIALPSAGTRAALTGILGVSAAQLWSLTRGRGHLARALLLGMLPPAAAFGAIALAYSHMFSGLGASIDRRLGLAALVFLAGIAAVGAAIAARAARTARSDDWEPLAWLATIALASVSVWHGFPAPASGVAALPLGSPAVVATIGFAAAVGGAITILVVLRRLTPAWSIPVEHDAETLPRPTPGGSFGTSFAIVCWCLSAAAIVWTTVAGLRVGFL